MDSSRWTELGLVTGTKQIIERHSRLLRSLRFGDEDYDGHVYDLVPSILGAEETWGKPTPPSNLLVRYPRFNVVSDYLDLHAWLALNEPTLYGRVFIDDRSDALLPDGTVLSEAESIAVRMNVAEMRRQVERIRRDFVDDPEAAIGQAKELIETTCKTILGITGDAGETPDLPSLIKQTQLHLGLDPSQVDEGVEARASKRLLGGVASVLNGAGDLRNVRGTGHGRSGSSLVDPSLARLAVGLVLPVVVYLIEAWEDRSATPISHSSERPRVSSSPSRLVQAGGFYEHATFGEGQVVDLTETPHGRVATVEFGPRTGRRRILLPR